MNLMIVEDEIVLLNNLAYNIPWEDHGIEVVGTAENGVDALAMAGHVKPDIVLLDIEMPEMDGLTFARQIMMTSPGMKVILLSGHDEFKYAQTAIELNVHRYLLKPIEEIDILNAVLEAGRELKEELDVSYNMEIMKQNWADDLPRLQEAFWQNWVFGNYEGGEVYRKSKELAIEIPDEQLFAVAIVDIDPLTDSEARFSGEDNSLLQFSVKSIAKDYLSNTPCHVFSHQNESTLILFLCPADRTELDFGAEVHVHVSRLLSTIKQLLQVTASAGIGSCVDEPSRVVESYRQAGRALQTRVVYGPNIAIPFREEDRRSLAIPVETHLENVLVNALETGNQEKAILVIQELLQAGMEKAQTVEEVHENVLYFSSLFVRMIQSQGWSVQQVVGDNYVYFQNLQSFLTKEHILQWLYSSVKSIVSYAIERKSSHSHKLVEAMLQQVEEGIYEDIGLYSVAQKLYLNESYLSRLFKQHMGQSFISYIVEQKMKVAMTKLQEGMKVYDTSRLLGYRDVSYFSKVFRKHWGKTPGEAGKL